MKLLFMLPAVGCAFSLGPADKPAPNALIGTWRLVAQQVMVVDGRKLPNETLVFDDNRQFLYFHKKHLVAQGTYHVGLDSTCGRQNLDQLILEPIKSGTYAPSGTYTLHSDTLIIDMTNTCASDEPIFTYLRQP